MYMTSLLRRGWSDLNKILLSVAELHADYCDMVEVAKRKRTPIFWTFVFPFLGYCGKMSSKWKFWKNPFENLRGDMDSRVVTKFGESRPLGSGRNVVWF